MTCQPHAFPSHAGYILVDLDQAEPAVLETMCAHGHQPCVVLETSPGHLQAGVHVSTQSLPPAVASAIGRELARLSHGHPASTDWRQVGPAGRMQQSKTTPASAQRIGSLGETSTGHAGLGPP